MRGSITRLLLLAGLLCCLCASRAHATNCALTSGASQSTIQAALTAAGSGSCTGTSASTSVSFGAGTFGPISSQVTIPCGVTLITGTVVPYANPNVNQTAIIDGPSSSFGFGYGNCSTALTIQYLQWNGEQSSNTSGNAGGFITIQGTTSNVTIQNNWIHGLSGCNNDASHGCGGTVSNGINIGGGGGGSTTTNTVIQYNEFGATSFGDCSAAMNDQVTNVGGGNCNGVGVYGNTANVSVVHNNFHYLEQGAKYYEVSSYGNAYCNPFTFSYNTITEVNRIGFESQCNIGTSTYPTLMYVQYNAIGNRYSGADSLFDLSIANGCGNFHGSYCVNHVDYNTDIQNFKPSTGSAGLEFWGQDGSTGNYNLLEGWVAQACAGFCWDTNGVFTFAYNTMNIYSGSYFQNGGNPYIATPTLTGNITSNTGSGTYASATPTISLSGATFTLTNTGTNRDTNTTIWYTTDGSTPVPGTGTAQPYTAPITVSATTTVKAVGMWGSINQPTSWASGYGYVPSSVVSATYTAGCIDNITSYGAVGNGSTDNTTAIQNAFNAAASASPKCSVEIPNGTFNHSGTITATGISVFGLGSGSILQATNVNTQAVILLGTGPSLTNMVINGTGTSRQTSANPSAVLIGFNSSGSVVTTSNFVVSNVAICCAENVGIYDFSSNGGTIENVTVHNTYADSITSVEGANNILIQNNLVYNSGDDGMSNNSYTTDSTTVTGITINENVVLPGSARGLECSGCSNTTFTNNYVDHDDSDADLFISSETSSYQTKAVSNITATGNTFVRGGPGQGAVEIWADGSTNSISNVNLNNNTWYNTLTFTGVQIAGAGTVSGISIQNSNAYINPVAFCTNQIVSGNSCPGSPQVSTYSNNTTPATTTAPGPSYGAGTVPIFSLPAGNYSYPQSLSFNNPTVADATYYCTTSSTSCTPATSGTSLTLSGPETVCADGVNSASEIPVTSAVICAQYTGGSEPTAATPVFSPAAGTFWPSTSVSISDSTTGATICTTRPTCSTPTTSSLPVYSSAIPLSSTTTLQAIAAASGYINSAVASGTYTASPPALTGCYQGNTTPFTNTLSVGGTIQQYLYGTYATGTSPMVISPGPDANGTSVASWGLTGGTSVSIGAVGSAHPGLVTAVSTGSTELAGHHIRLDAGLP